MSAVPRELLRVGRRIIMVGALADRPAPCPSADGTLYLVTDDDGGTLFRCDGYAGGGATWAQAAPGVAEVGVGSNDLLDGSAHADTLAGTVVQGDMIVGDATPKWARRALGTAARVWLSDGTDPGWGYVAPMAVWGYASSSAVVSAGLTSDWTAVPTVIVHSVVVPGGWLTGFGSLAHRFTIEAYRSTGTGTIEFRLQDVTNALTLATITGVDAATRTFYSTDTFSNIPAGDAMIELQMRWVTSASEFGMFGGGWHAQPDVSVS